MQQVRKKRKALMKPLKKLSYLDFFYSICYPEKWCL